MQPQILPLIGVAIRAARTSRSLSQSELAKLVGASSATVSRWEQGERLPSGDAPRALKAVLGITDIEMSHYYEDWMLNRMPQEFKYRISGAAFRARHGIPWNEFLTRLIHLDTQALPYLTEKEEGSVEQWVPIFDNYPETWKLLTFNHEIVGYWHFLALRNETFDEIAAGRKMDSEITLDDLDNLGVAGDRNIYVVMVVIDGPHRKILNYRKLMNSFIVELERMHRDGGKISRVCAISYSEVGEKMCDSLALQHKGVVIDLGEGRQAKVFTVNKNEINSYDFKANLQRVKKMNALRPT